MLERSIVNFLAPPWTLNQRAVHRSTVYDRLLLPLQAARLPRGRRRNLGVRSRGCLGCLCAMLVSHFPSHLQASKFWAASSSDEESEEEVTSSSAEESSSGGMPASPTKLAHPPGCSRPYRMHANFALSNPACGTQMMTAPLPPTRAALAAAAVPVARRVPVASSWGLPTVRARMSAVWCAAPRTRRTMSCGLLAMRSRCAFLMLCIRHLTCLLDPLYTCRLQQLHVFLWVATLLE